MEIQRICRVGTGVFDPSFEDGSNDLSSASGDGGSSGLNANLDQVDEQVGDAMRGERCGITREGEEKNEEEQRRMRRIPLTDVNYLSKNFISK